MKVCVYEHPTEREKAIVRFEEFPLYDYCKRVSFFIDLKESDYQEFIQNFSEIFGPEDYMVNYGRTFLIFSKERVLEIVEYLKLATVAPVQLVKGGDITQ